MSTAIFNNFQGPNNSPANFPYGFTTGDGTPSSGVNNIGTPGQAGFGVGVCPGPLPDGMQPLPNVADVMSDNYGNYRYSDGSATVWIPAFFYKWGTGANGLALNAVDIKAFGHFASVAAANASGYALHRAFYDGGAVQPGVFVDKYLCSNNAGIASSLKNGNPLSSAGAHNPFSALNGAPANNYGGAIAAAKTRGAAFFCNTRFIFAALAMLAYAHARAASSTAYCAWWDASGVASFPKGCNNNALGDVNDGDIRYLSDGYSNCGKTGSANLFARTTHNGQNSGVADLNGNILEVTPGLTSDGTTLYALKTTARMRAVTGGNSLTTDLWGAPGIAALCDALGETYQSLTASNSAKSFGSASQVFSAASAGADWAGAGLGIPLLTGVGGTNAFGGDGLWDYKIGEMCPLSGGHWGSGSMAGVWALDLSSVRATSAGYVGFRAALYL